MSLSREIIEEIRANIRLDTQPKRIRDLVEAYLRSHLSATEAVEQLDLQTRRAIRYLRNERQHFQDAGIDPWFEFNSSSPDWIQGPYFVEPRDTPSTKHA